MVVSWWIVAFWHSGHCLILETELELGSTHGINNNCKIFVTSKCISVI